MLILAFVVVFYVGGMVGYLLRNWAGKEHGYAGIIHVDKADDKLVYTLELTEDPEALQYNTQVLFKVETVEESLDRD